MSPIKDPDFSAKVLAGIKKAVDKVYEKARQNDEELVIYKDGKTTIMKARDIK